MKRPGTTTRKGEKRTEKDVLSDHLVKQGLKRSDQREAILEVFLKAKGHVSVDDLLGLVQRRYPDVGRATVYRTLKLFQEAGLASELAFDGRSRFEVDWNRAHHDHLICQGCGEIFEFTSPEIERLQDAVASRIGFVIRGHRHQVFGDCAACSAKTRAEPLSAIRERGR